MAHRSTDWFFLLACGISACGPSSDGGTSGSHEEEVDDAIAACSGYAHKLDQCYADAGSDTGGYGYAINYLSALGYCISYLGYAEQIGPACKTAIEEQYACISQLECGDLLVEGDGGGTSGSGGMTEPSPCDQEFMAVEAACSQSDTSG